MNIETDVVIIGSGIAALQAARFLSKRYSIHIVTKSELTNGSSYKAQGGIAVVISEEDEIALHVKDTIYAGEHHHSSENVEILVEEGKKTINQLIAEKFPIDRQSNGKISLGLEGAHSLPRIIHSGGDATGKALVDYLIDNIPSNVTLHEFEMAYELLLNTNGECIGVKTKDKLGNTNTYLASYVILASGGAGALYACTSNSKNSFGDGIALAYLAGAKIADMEFVQFHPSLLFINGKACGLVSEAVRGAGGYFVDKSGRKIMEGKHPLGDLAPRHITAFEMYKERANGNEVFINISSINHFPKKFPTITRLCEENGISISDGKIPISPGSHFLMGGVVADSFGRTTIPRLFAIGEVACTGVHGANRLASNSLLEGMTFGKRMAEHLLEKGSKQKNFQVMKNNYHNNINVNLLPVEKLQKEMLDKAGILRDSEGLLVLVSKLPTLEKLSNLDLSTLNTTQIEQIFMHITANLIVHAALERKESRGAHIRRDYQDSKIEWQNKWIVFDQGKMKVSDSLYEFNQTPRHAQAVF